MQKPERGCQCNANSLAVVILSRTCAVRRCIKRASKRIAVRVDANARYKRYGVEVRIEVEMRTLAFTMHNCGRNSDRTQNVDSRQRLTRTVSKLDRRYRGVGGGFVCRDPRVAVGRIRVSDGDVRVREGRAMEEAMPATLINEAGATKGNQGPTF